MCINQKIVRKIKQLMLSLLLIVPMFAGLTSTVSAEEGMDSALVASLPVQEALDAAANHVLANENLSDWAVHALARAGKIVPNHYLANVAQQLQENQGKFVKVTDLERIALTIKALGKDPQQFAGLNLIKQILNHDKMINQGANGPIYALLVLAGKDYIFPTPTKWNADKLISWILTQQHTDGSWALVSDNDGDIDITATALTALAPYRDEAKVEEAVNKAVQWLSTKQMANGGFKGADYSESTAQVIIALSSLGLDSASESFTKSTANLLTHLFKFRQTDGSFSHSLGAESNAMATEQALQALVAYQLFTAKQGSLYQIKTKVKVHVQVEGPQATVAMGTAQGATALEALEALLTEQKLDYKVTEMSFGKYVSSIHGINESSYGGYDGWGYGILRNHQWIFPDKGIADFELQTGDKVVVYYGIIGDTQLVNPFEISPVQPQPGTAFSVLVTKSKWNWNENKIEISPAAGALVDIGGTKVIANEQGEAGFVNGLSEGRYHITVTGYQDSQSPSLVRNVFPLTIYSDTIQVSAWALSAVSKSTQYGLISGAGVKEPEFAPISYVTRAEFASILVRLLGEQPFLSGKAVYSDVSMASWYGGYVAKAKLLGWIDANAALFHPNRAVTREEMAIMLARALNLSADASAEIAVTDLDTAAKGALPYIQSVYQQGLMVGSDGHFAPKAPVTREMAAVVAAQAYESLHANE